jgi:hypothetical protein
MLLLWAAALLGLLLAMASNAAQASSTSGHMPQRLEYGSYHKVCVQAPFTTVAVAHNPVHAVAQQYRAAA